MPIGSEPHSNGASFSAVSCLGPMKHGQREEDEPEAAGEQDGDQDGRVGDGHRAGNIEMERAQCQTW